jgi:predicted metalloprotease with PDZ domain
MLLKRPTPLIVFALLLLFPAAARAQTRAPEINFQVSMPRPHTRLLEVEMRLRYAASPPAVVELSMPVWTPGSYLVREFERHVQDFAPEAEGGRALRWTKTDKNTWRVETGGARELRVRYGVYANELSVRTNHLDDRRAVWNNAALLMFPEGHLAAPSTVRVVPFGSWRVATGLPPVSGQSNAFRADNFDQLYDSPFLVSEFTEVRFDVRGVPHRVVFDGPGNYDPERVRRDVPRIFEAAAALMGDLPYKDYTVLVAQGAGRGGLEHLNSTLLLWPRFRFSAESDWLEFLALVSHEVFHAWNVKLIRPEPLGPFDYSNENYTRLLWVAEGVTSYYEPLLLRRAGLTSDQQFLETHARLIQQLQETPGRFEQSLEEASFDAWIKYYRADENTVNSSVSYYDKGQIVALLLDLEIRRRTDGRRSLDDVMRRLYAEFGKRDRQFTPADFQRAAEAEAGGSLEEFFAAYVRGRRELDYNAAFETVGLRLDTKGETQPGGPARERAWLGANLVEEGGRLSVRNVPAGTPAYEQGLFALDQIVAVEGHRATRDFLDARLREKRPGDTLALTVFRADELRTLNIKLGARVEAPYRLAPVPNPGERQKRLYQSWLIRGN